MIPVLITFAVVGAMLSILALQRRASRARRIGRSLLVSYATIALLLVVGEGYFRFVHADSEGRLASNNWMDRYWQTNTLGFRDREWTPADYADKKRIVVIGDSFTAGWGVENSADRFSNVLAARLGDEYALFNLGIIGTSTPHQLETLQTFPIRPLDTVILQYFLNDIDWASLRLGLGIMQPYTPPLAQESYLANYLYSRFPTAFHRDYWSWEYSNYDNFVIWETHVEELQAFNDYVDSLGARLIVVIFPNLQDPVRSIPYVDRVAQFFEAQGRTEILKLFDAAAAWQPADLIVSARDPHPSAAFHRHVGELIYQTFFASPTT